MTIHCTRKSVLSVIRSDAQDQKERKWAHQKRPFTDLRHPLILRVGVPESWLKVKLSQKHFTLGLLPPSPSFHEKETQQPRAMSSFSIPCPYFSTLPFKKWKPQWQGLIFSLLSRITLYYSLPLSHEPCPLLHCHLPSISVYSSLHLSFYVIFTWWCA